MVFPRVSLETSIQFRRVSFFDILDLHCDHNCASAANGIIFHHFHKLLRQKNSHATIKDGENSLNGLPCLKC